MGFSAVRKKVVAVLAWIGAIGGIVLSFLLGRNTHRRGSGTDRDISESIRTTIDRAADENRQSVDTVRDIRKNNIDALASVREARGVLQNAKQRNKKPTG